MNKKQAREMGIEDGYWMVRTNWNEYVHQFIILDRMSYIEFMDSVLDAVAETEVNSRDEDTKNRFNSGRYPYHVLLKEYEAGVVVGAKRAVKELKSDITSSLPYQVERSTLKEQAPATYISSQRHLDDDTVEDKRAAGDYACSYVDVTVQGVDYRVLVDGHHSYAAAAADGETPDMMHDALIQQDVDALGSLVWLEANQHDADWYDLDTKVNVW